MFYDTIIQKIRSNKLFALLIDPEKYTDESLVRTVKTAEIAEVDFYLVGGSIISDKIDGTISLIKKLTKKPVIIFPGSLLQISPLADGILLLSLISGRNPEFLIGNQVIAAPYLKRSNLEIISTSYILIESAVTTSVEYVSNTKPIPASKTDLVVATAMAGEMLGHKLIYLEAGSGAEKCLSQKLIEEVKKNINIPLVVGGGIRKKEDVMKLYHAGADIVVVGNAVEENYTITLDLAGASR
jgi:putative glycerol-1-phosphate prenyltransferase